MGVAEALGGGQQQRPTITQGFIRDEEQPDIERLARIDREQRERRASRDNLIIKPQRPRGTGLNIP